MREDNEVKITTDKFDRDRYLKRNSKKCKKSDTIQSYSNRILYDVDKSSKEIDDYIRILNKEGNVAISTLRYNFYKNMLPKHKIIMICEYESTNDIIILEKE